jgi:hypothetical protein
VSDQNQILRLLATIREETATIRSRQEELYELLISYKDQLQDLKQTVVDKLSGLPRSPYIAGQLVPAPHKREGVDDYREVLATYLHKVTEDSKVDESDEQPSDLVWEKTPVVKPDEITLEEDEDDDRPRRHHGGGAPRGRRDNDLERGPDRDIEPIDLDDDEDEDEDEGEGEGEASDDARPRRRKRRRRGGRGRKREGGGAAAPSSSAEGAGEAEPQG